MFYLNLPIGAVALLLVVRTFSVELKKERGPRLDYAGAAGLIAGMTPLLLALSLGGHELAWTSTPLLAMLLIGIAFLTIFARVGMRSPEPVVPLALLRSRLVGTRRWAWCSCPWRCSLGRTGDWLRQPGTLSNISSAAAAEQNVTFELDRPPNLRQTLGYARMGGGDPSFRIIGDSVWRSTRTPLGPATQRVYLTAGGRVAVDAWGPGAEWLLERAPALCGRHDDPRAFQPDQALLRDLVRWHPGLRIGRNEAVFETALLVTLEQRVATRDAWLSWRKMVRTLGEPAPGPLPGMFVPPSPERVAATPYQVFHRFGVERRRADILRRAAVVARRLEETVALPIEAAYARFRAIPGVGPWTAARTALIALGDPDAVAVGDLHLPHMVSWHLAGERRGSDERMLELLEPYRGHRGRVIRLLLAGAVPIGNRRQLLP